MRERITSILYRSSLWIFLGLLAYMPFHIFISTWIGSSLGVLEIAKVAKDVVLVLGFGAALLLSINKAWFRQLLRQKIIWLIAAYILLHVVLAIVKPTDPDAEILGVVYNTRFLVFFLYGLLLIHLFPSLNLQKRALKIVVGVGIIVALFGVIQYLVLPNSVLEHVGYSRQNGVLPAFFIDDKPDLERVMSTLRDPNSLGSYLLIVGMVLATILFATKRPETRKMMFGGLMLTFMCMIYTFSRSAWLGLILAAGIFMFMADTPIKRWIRSNVKSVSFAVVVAMVTLAGIFFAVKDTYFVQNVVFHADQSTVLEDPNELRVRFWQESVLAIILQPEGTGPGTAGLASIRNDRQGTVLNENYYLQIANEVGVIGLALFLMILGLTARELFRRRTSMLSVALLASFAGLALTNFLVHIWSNEAVAYTWWGLTSLMFIRKATPPKLIPGAKLARLLSSST